MTDETDRRYMELALELAGKGRGTVSPNPMVGAVVVRNGEVVGSGWHQRAGTDHAEVIALREAGDQARGATLYVTLEPCCHHGRTPPCTEAVRASGVKRVVAAMLDDNPKVCGGGASCISDMGVEITVGVLEDRARRLNEAYLTWITTGRPFVTLKLAVTLDGKIADADGHSRWITGPEARIEVHRWRSWSDAVMVGAGTVLADNPSLTVRDASGRDPIKVIVDSTLRTPPDAKALTGGRCLIAATARADESRRLLLKSHGAEILIVDDADGRVSLPALMQQLGGQNITSVFCEGGSELASGLIRARLVDKIMFHIAPKLLGKGINALGDIGIAGIGEAIRMTDVNVERAGDDILVTGYPLYAGNTPGNKSPENG